MTGGPSEAQALLRDVINSRISSVRYLVPAGSSWPDGRADGLVHEIDHGVLLSLGNGMELSIQWKMEGYDEYLDIVLDPAGNIRTGDLIDEVDVSDLPEWLPVIGQSICGFGLADHVPNEGSPHLVWSVRLEFANGKAVVLALGEVQDGLVAYMPDAVIVLFDVEEAQHYRLAGNPTTAWGEDQTT